MNILHAEVRASLRRCDALAHQLQLELGHLAGLLEPADTGAGATVALARGGVGEVRSRLDWLTRWLTPGGAGADARPYDQQPPVRGEPHHLEAA